VQHATAPVKFWAKVKYQEVRDTAPAYWSYLLAVPEFTGNLLSYSAVQFCRFLTCELLNLMQVP
jgi:hypothetical protein